MRRSFENEKRGVFGEDTTRLGKRGVRIEESPYGLVRVGRSGIQLCIGPRVVGLFELIDAFAVENDGAVWEEL